MILKHFCFYCNCLYNFIPPYPKEINISLEQLSEMFYKVAFVYCYKSYKYVYVFCSNTMFPYNTKIQYNKKKSALITCPSKMHAHTFDVFIFTVKKKIISQ